MRKLAGIGLVAAAAAVSLAVPGLAAAAPNAWVAQSVHKTQAVSPFGPPHTGDIVISPDPETLSGEPDDKDYVTFLYQVGNSGDAATVTFRWHATGTKRDGYTYWTAPIAVPQMWFNTDPFTGEECTYDTWSCRLRLEPGQSLYVAFTVRGNAPGSTKVYGEVSARDDSDLTNNRSEVYEGRVVCEINGGPGDDTLSGTSGEPESICGGGGDDTLTGVGNGDSVFGEGGSDVLAGAYGSQKLVGGTGFDWADYRAAPRRIRISLADKGVAGWGGDAAITIEGVLGSRYDDYIEGSAARNYLVGGGGADDLQGRGASDVLEGRRGSDEFISADASSDLVLGGRGADVAFRDSRDVVRSLRTISWAPFADLDIRPPR